MRIKYHTAKGSVYIHVFNGDTDYWVKEDTDGQIHPLAAAQHLSKARLFELIREYPSTLLDKTYCFDIGVEKEFFDDVQREPDGVSAAEETVILFLIKREAGHYGLGCSSQVVRVERLP